MCHLLLDASESVPKMSYKILQTSADKFTEHLVLEASVESEASVPLDLPLELVQLLQSSLPDEDVSDSVREQVSGYASLSFARANAWRRNCSDTC